MLTRLPTGFILGVIFVGNMAALLIGASESAQRVAGSQATATRLYLEFGDDFSLLAKPMKVDSPSYWCLSPFDWDALLEAPVTGNRYTISLGLANQVGSSPKGRLLAQILVKSDAKERVIASATFDTSTKYLASKATVTGSDANAQRGDTLILRVTRLEGMPCVFFSGDSSDHFVEVARERATAMNNGLGSN